MANQTISADAPTYNDNDTFCPKAWLSQFEANGGMWAVQHGKVLMMGEDAEALHRQLTALDAINGRERVKALILTHGRA